MWVRCQRMERIHEACRSSVSPGSTRRERAQLGDPAACTAGDKSCLLPFSSTARSAARRHLSTLLLRDVA